MKRFVSLAVTICIFAIFIVLFELQSCHLDPVGIDKQKTVCFNTEIFPMLKNSCGMCHGAGQENQEDFSVVDYNSIMRSVKAGDAKKSKLYKALGAVNGNLMPPDRPLSIDQRMLIEIWIQQGAPNNTCDTTTTTGNPDSATNKDSICFTQNILPILTNSCGITGCHDAATRREGYVLINYATLTQQSGNIVPFNPGASRIYKAMLSSGENVMPPFPYSPLTSVQLATFSKWIAQGAVNSDCPQAICDTTGTISYASQISPIIQNNCIGCHGNAYASKGGGVDLRSYSNVKSYADNLRNGIPVIDGAISRMSGFFAMPPSGNLDKCSIRKIELWIQQGKQQ
jgi:cytochrome c5